MNIEKVEEYLLNYTEDEKCYKEYYECKNDEKKLKEFLKKVDINFIKKKNILIPELMHCVNFPREMKEELFFEVKNMRNIAIQKHYRYTPEFKHKHSFFEVIYVYSGNCVQTIKGERVDLKRGDICIISTGVEHSLGVFDDSLILDILIKKSTFNETFFELLRNNNVLSTFFMKILNSKRYNNYIIFHTGEDLLIKKFILNMYKEHKECNKYSDMILNNILMIFFAYILRNHEENVELPNEINHDSDKIISILNYIQDNYASITLNELAQEFHFTVPYLSKIIKSYTGKNFTDILRKIKMQKASMFLITTNYTVTDIAYMVGYDNKEHFIRTFKNYFGISPSNYRKRINQKEDIELKID